MILLRERAPVKGQIVVNRRSFVGRLVGGALAALGFGSAAEAAPADANKLSWLNARPHPPLAPQVVECVTEEPVFELTQDGWVRRLVHGHLRFVGGSPYSQWPYEMIGRIACPPHPFVRKTLRFSVDTAAQELHWVTVDEEMVRAA